MKHVAWVSVVIVMFAAAGLAEGPGIDEEKIPTAEEIELYERGLEVRAREARLIQEQEMGELELEERRAEIERMRGGWAKQHEDKCDGLLLLILVTNILLTVWVFKDMHEQKTGRALWVPIVLLTGVFGAILYAIVRHTDIRTRPTDEGT